MLRHLIEEAVRQEGPVHEDRVLRAIRTAWGKDRSGSRITDAFHRVVRELARVRRDSDGFLSAPSLQLSAVRVPTTDDPTTEREVKYVPQEELRLAVARIVEDAHSIMREDLTFHVARLFGWRRRGPDVRAALGRAVDELVRIGTLVQSGQALRHAVDYRTGH